MSLDEWEYKKIKRLIDKCWEIRRANVEGGDICAGQLLSDSEFNKALEDATSCLGSISIETNEDLERENYAYRAMDESCEIENGEEK